MINDKRKENGLPPMTIVFVDMILADVSESAGKTFSNKVSSTNSRKYLAEHKWDN